ncbi:MAG TPA: TIGR03617 family F420-dependent LLM class oxidoreductase [Pseudonocardia sp.]|nr:TIGR03617 family F420-dependent LLM class oxidoreductase [Pseudonocardia sp.]
MKVDATLQGRIDDWQAAQKAEADGYDAVWLSEIKHDPFPMLAVAATRTERVQVGTAIALAFARNPMSMAVVANDLQLYSEGRFILGVGSQIKPHITKRFSMPWSAPADRMREYLLAMRAIWKSWETGEPLRFLGEHYTHTIMTPMFNPGPNPHGNPPIVLAGVGPRMTRVAGEVADGFFVHGFTTERYMRETTLPALLEGRKAGGHDDLRGFEISGLPFIVTGDTDAEMEANAEPVRKQIAFYGSTPSYWPVLEAHGWDELGPELNAMSKRGEWDEMGRRISDDVLDAFAVVARPDQVAAGILERYGDIFTRCGFYAPYGVDDGFWAPIMHEVQAAS